MAKIKLGPNITDIRGTFKEIIYSVAKRGVHYIKSKASSPANPQTELQTAIRTAVQISTQRWFNVLTEAQRAGWEELAERLSTLDSEDGGGINNMVPAIGLQGSGVNAYVSFRLRTIRAELLGSFSDDAPLGEDQPSIPLNVEGSYDSDTGTLTVTWDDPNEVDASGKMLLWIRSREKIYHKQIIEDINVGVETVDITSARGAGGNSFEFTDTTPQHLIIQMQAVNPSGYGSPGSSSVEVPISGPGFVINLASDHVIDLALDNVII